MTIFLRENSNATFLDDFETQCIIRGPIAKPKIQVKNSFLLLNGLFEQFVDGHHGWVIIKHSEFSFGPPFYSHDHMSSQSRWLISTAAAAAKKQL